MLSIRLFDIYIHIYVYIYIYIVYDEIQIVVWYIQGVIIYVVLRRNLLTYYKTTKSCKRIS